MSVPLAGGEGGFGRSMRWPLLKVAAEGCLGQSSDAETVLSVDRRGSDLV